MATEITYNGVLIHGCTTRGFWQEPAYDQSETDLSHHKFRIRVQGYVHGMGSSLESVYVSAPGGLTQTFSGGAPDAHQKIRYRLSEPRKPFEMKLDGVSLLRCDPVDDNSRIIANKDLNNGPKPRALEITHIVGANIFRVEWEVEIAMLGCDGGDSGANNGSGILSNRWSLTDEMDKQFMRTRTYSGRLRTISAKINPLSLASFVLPRLQKGFKRDRVRYVVSASGVEMDYTITDREVHLSAPAPATEMDIHHTEMTGDALKPVGECYVRVAGDRNADHRKLIQLAVQLVDTKLGIINNAGLGADRASIIESFAVTDIDGTGSHEVQVRARVIHNAQKFLASPENAGINAGVANPGGVLGRPLIAGSLQGYDPTVSVDLSNSPPLPLASAFSCALQIPCDAKHSFGENAVRVDDGIEGGQTSEEIIDIEAYQSEGDLPPDETGDYRSTEQKEHAYSFYQADNRYSGIEGTIQVPLSGQQSTSGDAGLNPTAAFVRLFPGQVRRVLTVKAERIGAWPVLPSAVSYTDSNGITHNTLSYELMPGTRERLPAGDTIYRSEAHYVWGLSRPPLASESLRIGRVPWDKDAAADESLGVAAFSGSEAGGSSGNPA